MSLETKHFYEFADFRLDPSERVLLRDGKPVGLTPKAFHLLKILVENHGHVVEKDRLIGEIWADSFVEDGNLAVSANMLRKALADDANHPRFIETIPRRGYRFIAEVNERVEDTAPTIRLNGNNQTSLKRGHRRYLSIGAAIFAVLGCIAVIGWIAKGKLFSNETSAPILSAPFSATKFSSSGTVTNAVISPDGKYAAFTDESGSKQSLWLRQLESGENIQIIPPSEDVYHGLAFSNSGNSIYFVRRPRSAHGRSALYRVTAFGGIPVKIVDGAQNWVSLSPDDKQVSFVRCNYKRDDNCSLLIADADGQNERTIATRPETFLIRGNQFSPDGRSIAFVSGRFPWSQPDMSLSVIDIATGSEQEVASRRFFDINYLHWLPAADGLLFTAQDFEDGRMSIWKTSISDGKAESLTKDASSYRAISIDKLGEKMIATQADNDFHLYINANGQTSLLTSARDIDAAKGQIVYSTFDGDIWSMNSDGSERRQLTTGPWGDAYPRASPDGRYIYFRSNRSVAHHIWRMNADGSGLQQITRQGGGYPCGVSPDGKWLYYAMERMLRKVPAEGGEEIQISDRKLLRPVCSPDGTFVAYFFLDKEFKIGVLRTDDGSSVKVLDYAGGKSMPVRLAWSPDNKTLGFIVDSDGKNVLWQQSLDEGAPRQIADLGGEQIRDLAILPDGRSFAFVRGKWINDAVLITGLK